jgi:hypothetical protein
MDPAKAVCSQGVAAIRDTESSAPTQDHKRRALVIVLCSHQTDGDDRRLHRSIPYGSTRCIAWYNVLLYSFWASAWLFRLARRTSDDDGASTSKAATYVPGRTLVPPARRPVLTLTSTCSRTEKRGHRRPQCSIEISASHCSSSVTTAFLSIV